MGAAVLPIAILFAGCRLGELLATTAIRIQFVTVRNNLAIAIHSVGSKSDMANQRSSPIVFGQLTDTFLCPVTRFVDWLTLRGISVHQQGLDTLPNTIIFPQWHSSWNKRLDFTMKPKKVIATSEFSRVIRSLEQAYMGRSPRFKAHSGRFTITTLALFGRDQQDQKLIAPELLEHQMHWIRNTSTLANYMGHNASFVKGGFYDKIHHIRNNDLEAKIDEQSIVDFNTNTVDTTTFSAWQSKYKPSITFI